MDLNVTPHEAMAAAERCGFMTRRGMLRLVLSSAPLVTASEERLLDYAMVGSTSCKGVACWNAISDVRVQRALIAVATAPRTPAEVDRMLSGSPVTAADLQVLRLVRRDRERYWIGFSLLLTQDVRVVRKVAERHGRILADEILSHRAEIDAALRTYPAPQVDRGDVAFIVLGCFCLDWDGLFITKAKGYRMAEGAVKRPDGKYVPWAEERTAERFPCYDRSHSNRGTDPAVVSFSDGTAHDDFLPRVWRSEPDGDAIRKLLLAMRQGESTLAGITRLSGRREDKTRALLAELSDKHYIGTAGDTYHLVMPVLSKLDGPMVARIRAVGRAAIENWLASHYSEVKSALADTAPARAGVRFEEMFNQIWHFIFGRANVMLIDAGLFSDPHAATHPWRGYTPAVFSQSVVR